MNVKFSPGPWSIDGSVNAGNLDVINGEGRIAMIDDSRSTGWNVPTINANARLIAAAPDLLAALREIHDAIAAGEGDFSPSGDWYREASAAIAKALGN